MPRGTQSPHVVDVRQMLVDEARRRRLLITVTFFVTVVIGAVAYLTAPKPFSLALLVLALSCVAALVRPTIGVYLIVVFSLIGDDETIPWWPFTKNLSSRESIMYISDVISLTPLEALLGTTLLAFLLRATADASWRFRTGRLFWPVSAFSLMLLFGFAHGILTNGDRTIAILEARPLFYIPVLYVLIVNLFTTRRQLRHLFVFALVAIAAQSMFSLGYYRALPAAERAVLETLTEHPASIGMNVVFVFFAALVLFGGQWRWIWKVGLLSLPVAYAYLISQRRAGMIALFIGLFVLVVMLFRRDRRLFLILAPLVGVLSVAFIMVTWNAQGVIGLPATAVKTILFPEQLSTHDRDSNLYRQLEAFNLWATIRSSPIQGLGFGHKFYVYVEMPDISFFEEWQYFPHNSVLWIWIKAGYFGFAAMLALFGRALMLGTRSALRVVSPADAAVVASSVAYVLMFLVFAYVDIAWGIRPAVLLAMSFAMAADFERLPPERPEEVMTTSLHNLRAVGV